jgi:hypothetical protein
MTQPEGESQESTSWLHTWLLSRGPSFPVYVLRMGLTSLVPSIVIAIVVFAALSPFNLPMDRMTPEYKDGPRLEMLVAVVVVAPIVETLLMSGVIGLVSLVTKRTFLVAACSAVVWAGMHSALYVIWGLIIAWPFFVFSCAYLAWRPLGWWRAVAVAASIHMFQNLLPGLVVFLT